MTQDDKTAGKPDGEIQLYSSSRILWRLSVFLIGFLSLLALHWFFTLLIGELEEQTSNERARLFVGEQIVGEIRLVESGVYRMATTLGVPAQRRIQEEIGELIDGIRHNLQVLKIGGVARQTIRLNLEGRDRMIKEVIYTPEPPSSQEYILEIIDLTPKLREIESKVEELAALLEQRDGLRRQTDREGLFDLERGIKLFLKKLPPLFIRLTENANRMFYESHQRLAQIEQRIAEQTRRYRINELVMVAVIIVSVMLLGLLFARQIERSNQQLAGARDRMREAKDEAERANRAKSEFLSRMSHELRTPMNAILGFSQLLEADPALQQDQRESVMEIDKAGRHLLELINEILDLAKIEAGRLILEHIEFSPHGLAEDIIGIMHARTRDKGLTMHVYVAPQLPEAMAGDPTRLKQILLNLLGNAIKFTEQGSVSLSIEAVPERSAVRFEVSDTGVGFDDNTGKKLFQPFTQADESTTRRFGGTGLGLVISKELVEAMGGRIGAHSSPGEGSCFWFELPAPKRYNPAITPDPHLNGLRVLVAARRSRIVRPVQDYLTALGVEVNVAGDADAALNQLQQAQQAGAACDLVLVDAALPEQGARQLAVEILEDMQLRQPRRGLLTDGTNGSGIVGLYDFALALPLAVETLRDAALRNDATLPREATVAKAGATLAGSDTAAIRVLLVEDQDANRRVARSMLQRIGVEVDCAEDGQQALDALQQRNYDLVFMDMQMPVMDGIDASRRIRQNESDHGLPRIPIVAMTANAMEEDRRICLAAGMDDHVPKPISFESIEEKIIRWTAPAAVTDHGAMRPTSS